MLSTCWENSAYTSCMAFWEFSSGKDIDFKHFMFEKIQNSYLFFSWWKGKINYKDSWNAFQSGSHFTAVLCLSVRLKLNFLYTFYSHGNSDGVSLWIQLESLTLWGMELGKMRKQTAGIPCSATERLLTAGNAVSSLGSEVVRPGSSYCQDWNAHAFQIMFSTLKSCKSPTLS